MDYTKSILEDVRESVGLSRDSEDFNVDLLMHINACIGKLNQNGVGNSILVNDTSSTWTDLMNPEQSESNKYFNLAPLYIFLSTKLLFDPPPPSTVEHYSKTCDEMLWRLKIAYE